MKRALGPLGADALDIGHGNRVIGRAVMQQGRALRRTVEMLHDLPAVVTNDGRDARLALGRQIGDRRAETKPHHGNGATGSARVVRGRERVGHHRLPVESRQELAGCGHLFLAIAGREAGLETVEKRRSAGVIAFCGQAGAVLQRFSYSMTSSSSCPTLGVAR